LELSIDRRKKTIIFGLSGGRGLATSISESLGISVGAYFYRKFNDGEQIVYPLQSVREKRVFVVQSFRQKVDEQLIELLLFIDSLRRASVGKINLILPYICYFRQDRQVEKRQPISGRLIADLISLGPIDRVVTIDLHSPQAAGFFNVKLDDIRLIKFWVNWIKANISLTDLVIGSADYGGVQKATKLASLLGVKMIFVDKKREDDTIMSRFLLGEVRGKDVCIVDDILDTGGTLLSAIKKVKEEGAKKIYAVITHPVFSPRVFSLLSDAFSQDWLDLLVVTNTIPIDLENTSLKPFLKKVVTVDVTKVIIR